MWSWNRFRLEQMWSVPKIAALKPIKTVERQLNQPWFRELFPFIDKLIVIRYCLRTVPCNLNILATKDTFKRNHRQFIQMNIDDIVENGNFVKQNHQQIKFRTLNSRSRVKHVLPKYMRWNKNEHILKVISKLFFQSVFMFRFSEICIEQIVCIDLFIGFECHDKPKVATHNSGIWSAYI